MNVKIKKHRLVLKGDCSKIVAASGSGNVAIVNPKNSPLVKLDICGASEQKKYEGYNLFNLNDEYTEYDCSLQKTETGVLLTSLVESPWNYVKYAETEAIGGETYTISADITLPDNFPKGGYACIYVQQFNSVHSEIHAIFVRQFDPSGEQVVTFTAFDETVKFCVNFYMIMEQPTVEGMQVKFDNVLFTKSDKKLPYEPFTGGVKSPSIDNPQEIKSLADNNVYINYKKGEKLLSRKTLYPTYTVNGQKIAMAFSAVGGVYDEFVADCRLRRAEYIKRVGKIDSYNGEEVGDEFISTTGGLDTGATIIYPLPQEEIIDVSDSNFAKSIFGSFVPKEADNVFVYGAIPANAVSLAYRKII